MNTQKNLLIVIGEWWEEHRASRRATPQGRDRSRLARLLPTPGNAIFTLAMIALLVAAQSVGALPLGRPLASPSASSIGTIAYQGRLADTAGAPLTGTYNMIFRLYSVSSGGTPLWEEQWTGSNGVRASDGLFNVMLGSLTPIPQTIITGHDQLFLGIMVGTDDEMAPRVQLGSVPFATQALTVPDGSVSTAKIADGAVTQAKLGTDVSMVPPDGSVTTAKIADGAVTSAKLNIDSGLSVTGDLAATGNVSAARLASSISRADNTDLAAGNMGRYRWRITTVGSTLEHWDVEETWMHFGGNLFFVQWTFGLTNEFNSMTIVVPANGYRSIQFVNWKTQEFAASRFVNMEAGNYLTGVATRTNLINLTHWASSPATVDFVAYNGLGGTDGAFLNITNPSGGAVDVRSFSIQGFVQLP